MNLKKLFGLCEHCWKTIETLEIFRKDRVKTGLFYILRCEKCGEIVHRRVGL